MINHPVTARERKLLRVSRASFSIPTSIPLGGVALLVHDNGHIAVQAYLRPASSTSGITRAQAGASALRIDDAPGLSVSSATYANVTIPADVLPARLPVSPSAVVGRDVWVVVVASPDPVAIPLGCQSSVARCGTAVVSSDTLLLDSATGNLLYGFFS